MPPTNASRDRMAAPPPAQPNRPANAPSPQTASDDLAHLKKIADAAAEVRRRKALGKSAGTGNHIDERPGQDVVNQEKLNLIADYVWATLPRDKRAGFTAQDWHMEIVGRCAAALKRAEQRLDETRTDDKIFMANLRILRRTFAQQVHRAMQTVAEKYRPK